jgi:hypothetical protein
MNMMAGGVRGGDRGGGGGGGGGEAGDGGAHGVQHSSCAYSPHSKHAELSVSVVPAGQLLASHAVHEQSSTHGASGTCARVGGTESSAARGINQALTGRMAAVSPALHATKRLSEAHATDYTRLPPMEARHRRARARRGCVVVRVGVFTCASPGCRTWMPARVGRGPYLARSLDEDGWSR